MVPLTWYLVLAALLFSIGLYGALSNKNAVLILMSVELLLNAVNINLVAFWRHITPQNLSGQVFAIMVITVAAAEVAIGLALVLAVYRQRQTIDVEELDLMKG
ncbi:MAG: NADH-quinone oxidoreductase subunit NuoK [Anaerolineae bacterium]